MKLITRLTEGLFGQYGNRKKPGRFSIFVNTRNNEIIPVPRTVEHVDVARRLYGDNPSDLAYIVPVHIDVRQDSEIPEVQEIITGECGMEELLNVAHPASALEKAAQTALQFVLDGEISCSDSIKSTISRRYCGA